MVLASRHVRLDRGEEVRFASDMSWEVKPGPSTPMRLRRPPPRRGRSARPAGPPCPRRRAIRRRPLPRLFRPLPRRLPRDRPRHPRRLPPCHERRRRPPLRGRLHPDRLPLPPEAERDRGPGEPHDRAPRLRRRRLPAVLPGPPGGLPRVRARRARPTPPPGISSTELAVPIPNEHTERYAARAATLGVYIQTGTFLEVGPPLAGGGVQHHLPHRPGGPPRPATGRPTRGSHGRSHASPHDVPGYDEEPFPVAETPIGRIGCGDLLRLAVPRGHPRSWRRTGPRSWLRVSAYMDPWGATPPMDWWTLVNRARAIENLAYVVAANQGPRALELPALLVAGRQHGRRLRRPGPGAGRPRTRGEDRGGGDRPGGPPRRARLPAGAPGRGAPAHRAYPVYRSPRWPAGRFPAADPEGDRTVEENEEAIRAEIARSGRSTPGASPGRPAPPLPRGGQEEEESCRTPSASPPPQP